MRIIELHRSNNWNAEFLEESVRIHSALRNVVLAIHHVGSTAILGILAKPIIDILLEVSSLDKLDHSKVALNNLGYEALGEYGLSGRRYYRKGDDQRTHHIHAYESCHPDLHRHIVFRDYLRANKAAAKLYENVKIEAAKKFRESPEAYAESKAEIIQQLEQEAQLWAWRYCRQGKTT